MARSATYFNSSTTYAAGDLCIYAGMLYIFTSAHSGAWNAADVQNYDDNFERDYNRIITGMNRAEADTRYANSMVFEESLIEGTRYRYIISNAIT